MLISPWRRLHRRHTCWRTGRRNTARNRFGQPSNQTACRPGSRGTKEGQDHLILQKWLSLKKSNHMDDYCCAEKKTPPCSRGSRTRASASLCKKDPRNINLRKHQVIQSLLVFFNLIGSSVILTSLIVFFMGGAVDWINYFEGSL